MPHARPGTPGAPRRPYRSVMNMYNFRFPWAAVAGRPLCKALPAEMIAVDSWLVWAYWHTGGRWAKQPRCPARSGTCIDSTDPSNLVPFREAFACFNRSRRYYSRLSVRCPLANPRFQVDGVGFAFLKSHPFAGVDLDKCVRHRFDDRGGLSYEIEGWAEDILALFPDTYAELSPSLTGVKLFLSGKLAPGRPGAKFTGLGADGRGAIEIYDSDRYFATTGLGLPNRPLALGALGPELNAFYDRLNAARRPQVTAPAAPPPQGDCAILGNLS